MLINTQQLAVAKYLYDPFGRILSMSGPLAEANLYRFSSKEYHPNSGLVYYLYRFYEPNLQRWQNRDPISETGGFNLYKFANNNPISRHDPDGRAPIGAVIGGAIVGGGGLIAGWCINRWACRRGRDIVIGLAEAQANANAPDGSTHRGVGASAGNDADLLTHCIATCDLVRNPGACGGPDRALHFMQEREVGNDPATQIDRLNNEVGAGVGIALDPGQTCTQGCLDALNKGLLYTLQNGRPSPSPPR
jgi:RHS repeat-associated protein